MNPYLETLKDELREDCGEDICQADWDEFYDTLKCMEDMAYLYAINFVDMDLDVESQHIATIAQGTRADLPSIVKYAYAAIEENLK